MTKKRIATARDHEVVPGWFVRLLGDVAHKIAATPAIDPSALRDTFAKSDEERAKLARQDSTISKQ